MSTAVDSYGESRGSAVSDATHHSLSGCNIRCTIVSAAGDGPC